jgi:hypothetical protein
MATARDRYMNKAYSWPKDRHIEDATMSELLAMVDWFDIEDEDE